MAAPAIPPSPPFRLTQPVADAATAAGVVFGDGVARKLGALGLGSYASAALPKFAAGLARVRNRTGRARWGVVGDSLVAGYGANMQVGVGNGSDAGGAGASRLQSLPSQIAARLAAAGIPTRSDAVFGSGNYNGYSNAAAVAYNPQISLGADWSNPAGGRAFTGAATGTTSFTFKPIVAADTFDIIYGRNTGLATFTVTDASGVLATINADGAFGNVVLTIKRDVASTLPISIQRTGVGGQILLQAIMPSNSSFPMLEIINMGQGGITAGQYATVTGQLSLPNAIATGGFDVVTIGLGGNDIIQGVSVSSFQTSLQFLATTAKNVADVGLVKISKATTPGANGDLPASYLSAIDAVAAATGAAFVADFNGGLSLVTGDYYDAIHLSGQGYGKQATLIANQVAALL